MVGWSGRRKNLTVLLFVLPTLLGVTIFSVYPFILNFFISLTNRGKFHPNPDCEDAIWSIVEPTCWLGNPPRGMAEPFSFMEPIYQNYATLLGGLFTTEGIVAIFTIFVALIPLIAAVVVNRRQNRQVTRTVSSGLVWLIGLGGVILLAWILNAPLAYRALMATGDFILVNLRTILYVAICIPLFFIIGLIMALILNNQHLRGITFFRVLLILPWAASTTAIMMSLIWQFFFRQQGTINQIISAFFQDFQPPAYLNDATWAFAIVVLVNLWYTYPFFMVTILGGLQSIPVDLYEAAEVDGASWWKQLTAITLPLLRPVVLPIVVLSALTTYKVDAVVWGVTKGGPVAGANTPGATEFIMVYGYKQIFVTQAFGRMGAFAVITFIFLFAATLYSLRITRITRGAYE
jgi:arabinogalactan oligomer/maltooligosaccharide transport system permease protein